MPTGIEELYDPPDRDFAERSGLGIPRTMRLPNQQVDPYVGALAQLERAGLLTRRFADTAIAAQLRRSSFVRTGVVPRGTSFEPGPTGVSEDDLRAFRAASVHRVTRDGDTAKFIPRDQTETSGFIRLLELFSAFNYAIAGAADAMVNLAQGEDEETNPFYEAWKGFTLKDKQTFSDVLENMGWEGEDGFAYWSRAATGFLLDVVLDPLNFVTLGAAGAAAKAGGVLQLSRRLRAGKVAFAGGTKARPVAVLDDVARKVAAEIQDAAKSGALDLPRVGATASESRKRAMAELGEFYRLESEIELGPRRGIPLGEDGGVRAFTEQERSFLLEGRVRQDTAAVFEQISRHRDPAALAKLKSRAGGGPDGFLSWLTVMGIGNREGDLHIASTLLEELLGREGRGLSPQAVMDYLAPKGGIEKLFDPGGLKLAVPFTDLEASIVEARWMDNLKLKMAIGASETFGRAARWLSSEEVPLAVRATTKGVGYVAENLMKGLKAGAEKVKLAFGVTAERSSYVNAIIKQRHSAVTTATPKVQRMVQEVLSTKGEDGKLKHLSPEESDVLFDAISTEETAAFEWRRSGARYFDEKRAKEELADLRAKGENARADEIERAYAGRYGYEEQHLEEMILSDGRLAGYSESQRQELLAVARKVDANLRRLYDEMTAEGLDVAFIDYYLPAQYENIKDVFRAEFGTEKLSRQISDIDPFARLRKMSRREAMRPTSQGGYGLRPIRNLYGLVFGRFMAAERARIERVFVSRLLDNAAIHPGQVDRALGAIYGPNGQVGNDIIAAIAKRTMARDFWSEKNMLRALPRLQGLKDAIETGKWEDASTWLEANADIVNAGLLEGDESFVLAVEQSVQRGVATIHEHLNAVGTDVQALTDTVRESIGKTGAEVLAEARKIAGSSAEGDVLFAAALGEALEGRVAKSLGTGTRAATLALAGETGKPAWAKAAKLSGEAAARFVVLDEALGSGMERLTIAIRSRVEERFGADLDSWAKQIVAMVRGRETALPSVRWTGFDQDMANLLARTLPARAIEESIDLSGKLTADEIVSGELVHQIETYAAHLAAGEKAEADDLLRKVWTQIGKSPYLAKHAHEWRVRRGLATLPFGEFSMEARGEVLAAIAKSRATNERTGLRFFAESPYRPSGTEARELRERVVEMMKDRLKKYAGSDREMFSTLMSMVNTPGSYRSGLHWQPWQGLQGLLESSYAARGSAVVSQLREAAIGTLPENVLATARQNKLKYNWLTRSLMDSPNVVRKEEMQSLKTMEAVLAKAVREAAERAGVDPSSAASMVNDFAEAMDTSVRRRGFRDTDMTEAHTATAAAIREFDLGMRRLFGDAEAGNLLHTLTSEFGDELLNVNRNTSDLTRLADDVRREMMGVLGSIRSIVGTDQKTVDALIGRIEGLTDEVRQMVASVESRAARFPAPVDEPAVGRKIASRFLQDDPIVGSFFRIADDLRRDANRMSQELDAAYRRSQLKLARAHEKGAVEVLAEMQTKIDHLLGPMRALQEQARVLDLVDTKLRLTPPKGGSQRRLFARWLEAAAADEFLRMKGATEGDWVAAVERVWSQGPSDAYLRAPWEAALQGSATETVLEEVRRAMTATPLEPGGVAAHRAKHRISAGRAPPPLESVQRAAIEALEDHPQLAGTLALDEGFIRDAERRAAAKVAGDASTAWAVTAWADEAFLPSDEVAEITARLREESAFLEAVSEVAHDRLRTLARLGAHERPQATAKLRAALLARAGPALSVEELSRAADGVATQAVDLVNAYLKGEPIAPELEDLVLLIDEAAKNVQGQGVRRELTKYLADVEERVEAAYEAVEGTPLLAPADEILGELGALSDSMALQRVAANDLAPEEAASYERFLSDLKVGPPAGRRAAYWLWRLGAGKGDVEGGLGMPRGTGVAFRDSMARYAEEGGGRRLLKGRVGEIRRGMTELVRDHAHLLEARRVAEKELELFRDLVIPDLERGKNLGLQYTPEEITDWRSIRQLRNYFRLQVLRAEHDGLSQVLAQLPSRDELRFLRVSQATRERARPADLERLGEMGIGGTAGAIRPADIPLVERLTAVAWESTDEQWRTVMSGVARRVQDRLGIPQEVLDGTEQDLLGYLEYAGVQGIAGEPGELAFAPGTLRVVGASMLEQVELNDAIAEIVQAQKIVKTGAGLANVPALEGQVRIVTRHMAKVSESPAEQAMALYALTGRSRADQLTALEAAHAIDYLGRHRSTEVLEHGQKALQFRAEHLLLGRETRGMVPKPGRTPEAEIGTPDELVAMQFPRMVAGKMYAAPDYLGKPFYVERWKKELIEQTVLQDRNVTGVLGTMIRKAFDPLTNWFKWMQTAPFPAFHTRNILDATIRTALAIGVRGLNMKRNYDLWKIVQLRRGEIVIRGQKYDAAFLLEMFERFGGKTDFHDRLGIVKVDIGGAADPRLSPFHENYALKGVRAGVDVLNNIGGNVDNTFRLSLFLDGIERGLAPAEAMRFAQKWAFDYAYGLSPFEREVMRRIFPFYTFARFNVPLMLEQMYKRPGLIAFLGKTHDLMSNATDSDLEDVIPPYIREAWRLRPEIRGGQLRVLSGTNMLAMEDLSFLGDLTRWRDDGLREGFAEEVIGRMNPMLKLPFELYVGHNFYFNSEIRDDETLRRAVWDDPVVSEWLQLRQVLDANGELMWRVNGRRWHALNQLHFSRLYRTLTAVIAEDDVATWERFLPLVTGLRLTKVDLDRRFQHLEAASNFNQAKIAKALEQGDYVAVKRVLGTVDRSEDRQERVDAAFRELKSYAPR